MYKFLCLAFAVCFLFSCADNDQPTPKTNETSVRPAEPNSREAVITGRIIVEDGIPPEDSLKLFYPDFSLYPLTEEILEMVKLEAPIDADFIFHIPIEVAHSMHFYYYGAIFNVLVEPGDSIAIELVFNVAADTLGTVTHFKQVTFNKEQQEKQTFVNEFYSTMTDSFGNPMIQSMEHLDGAAYKSEIEKRGQSVQLYLQELKKTTHSTSIPFGWAYNELSYAKAIRYFDYRFNKLFLYDIKEDLPQDFYSFLDTLTWEGVNLLACPSYRFALTKYLQFKMSDYWEDEKEEEDDYASIYYSLCSENLDSSSKELLLNWRLSLMLVKGGPKMFKSHEFYLEHIHTPWLKDSTLARLERFNKKFESRAEIENAIVISEEDDAFQFLKNKYEGKTIYLDVWATWCGPCKRYMPFTHQMEDELAGEDIVFVYLCVDSEEDKWNKDVEAEAGERHHYFINEAQAVEMKKIIHLTGVPTYVIIQKNRELILQENVDFSLYPAVGDFDLKLNQKLKNYLLEVSGD